MPLKHGFSDELKEILKKLFRKDKNRYDKLMKKIEQISSSDETTIEHYKNLRNNLKDQKRVHIDKSFVLTFKYLKEKKFILFADFDHHDNIYKK
ncbi:type II toxin-antitoxin system mRNA interferase toxin, RelE/StbE family [archaeon]|nr:type II toxin-antitoxin system mRNA interferase toxin, RelE/StbE family [archaeon]